MKLCQSYKPCQSEVIIQQVKLVLGSRGWRGLCESYKHCQSEVIIQQVKLLLGPEDGGGFAKVISFAKDQ
jgi:hypothetical protein